MRFPAKTRITVNWGALQEDAPDRVKNGKALVFTNVVNMIDDGAVQIAKEQIGAALVRRNGTTFRPAQRDKAFMAGLDHADTHGRNKVETMPKIDDRPYHGRALHQTTRFSWIGPQFVRVFKPTNRICFPKIGAPAEPVPRILFVPELIPRDQ